ncbi:hypothetical protein JOC86_001809 [Bacillus pakistanensis]|uniref:DUF2642 domain-containing protein n=1 Tax=Rossellomorea pakistanensis TaxID=992288 RepID=A0ABS2NBP7_9BACI|nr:DUF2642 domain-containing protein [Bacillus pakistanensis]MBM7585267.1 hypothetical protein [Bacillus pakistanensis]
MKIYTQFIGEGVKIEISGKKVINGILIEVGNEILIVFNGEDYIYVPNGHIQTLHIIPKDDYSISEPTNMPVLEQDEELALRKILNSAKGVFLEIYVTGNQPLHGYITNVMNNYFSFYSPVYKTMLISLQHLKWIIPYSSNISPYKLSAENLPVNPISMSLARSFEVQIGKLSNKLIVFNLGKNEDLIGRIENIDNNIIEIITARGNSSYLNLQHIQTVHIP